MQGAQGCGKLWKSNCSGELVLVIELILASVYAGLKQVVHPVRVFVRGDLRYGCRYAITIKQVEALEAPTR